MSLIGLVLKQDATSLTTVGGTDVTLSSDGQDVKNGVHVADMAESDFTIRTNATFRNRNPQKQADGSYSKAKRFSTLVVPKDLGVDSGGVVFNLVRIEVEAHPKTTEAELMNLHLLAAQVLSSAGTSSFLVYGDVA